MSYGVTVFEGEAVLAESILHVVLAHTRQTQEAVVKAIVHVSCKLRS